MPTATERIAVRLEALGPAATSDDLPDSAIDHFWNGEGDQELLLTAALCLESLAGGAAMSYRISADGQSWNLAERQAQYERRAVALRVRYYGSGSAVVTRADAPDVNEFSAW